MSLIVNPVEFILAHLMGQWIMVRKRSILLYTKMMRCRPHNGKREGAPERSVLNNPQGL
jgi:hypothetical protein